jgi:hypothetical protein
MEEGNKGHTVLSSFHLLMFEEGDREVNAHGWHSVHRIDLGDKDN